MMLLEFLYGDIWNILKHYLIIIYYINKKHLCLKSIKKLTNDFIIISDMTFDGFENL